MVFLENRGRWLDDCTDWATTEREGDVLVVERRWRDRECGGCVYSCERREHPSQSAKKVGAPTDEITPKGRMSSYAS